MRAIKRPKLNILFNENHLRCNPMRIASAFLVGSGPWVTLQDILKSTPRILLCSKGLPDWLNCNDSQYFEWAWRYNRIWQSFYSIWYCEIMQLALVCYWVTLICFECNAMHLHMYLAIGFHHSIGMHIKMRTWKQYSWKKILWQGLKESSYRCLYCFKHPHMENFVGEVAKRRVWGFSII